MNSTNSEWRTFPSPQGEIKAYAVTPDLPQPWPALILIHPVTGLTERIRGFAADFAKEGYYVIAPDIYTHDKGYPKHDVHDIEAAAHTTIMKPQVRDAFITGLSESKRDALRAAQEWVAQRPAKTYIEIVRACFDALKDRAEIGRIGCMGYCMGGRLTLELAATGADLAAGIVYYGGHPGVEAATRITAPIQGHYGVSDLAITPKVYEFAAAMHEAGRKFTYSVYDDDHGFADHDCEATRLAYERSTQFLATYLR